MEQEAYDSYIEGGKIAQQVIGEGLEKVGEGVKLLDVAGYVERRIGELGAEPAFPVNISVNDIAAHYSPTAWDETTFSRRDIVKIDVGVHMHGYIADVAKTKLVGKGGSELITAVEKALESAIEVVEPGAKTSEIGGAIEETIKSFNLKPIENLTGHKLDRYSLHGGTTIPNISTRHSDTLHEGDVYAIEPFSTSGYGRVVEAQEAIIFKFLKQRPIRNRDARKLLGYVKKNYSSLPFAERWLAELMPRHRLYIALRQLIQVGALYAYNILREKERGPVAQAEHTVIVTSNGCEVTTG